MVCPALSHPLDHCGFTPVQNRAPSTDKETEAQKIKSLAQYLDLVPL